MPVIVDINIDLLLAIEHRYKDVCQVTIGNHPSSVEEGCSVSTQIVCLQPFLDAAGTLQCQQIFYIQHDHLNIGVRNRVS